MNLTLRVKTPDQRFIVKQARPWVEKYDHLAAPWDRNLFEQAFYHRLATNPVVASYLPKLLGSDPASRILVLEDLGEAADFSDIYSGARIRDQDADALADFLRTLHDTTEGSFHPDLRNCEMRQLNHEHIYLVPLAAHNGLSLERFEPGLGQVADRLKSDEVYVRKVTETGIRYLADGSCLLHGDYFPGSWLRTHHGPRVIDPEFCYFGDREFDVGCAIAHFVIAEAVPAARRFVAAYGADCPKMAWVTRYAAAEVMRRIMGVAQLPLPPTTGH